MAPEIEGAEEQTPGISGAEEDINPTINGAELGTPSVEGAEEL